MSECPNSLQQEHIADIAALKNEVGNLKDKVEILGSIENAITRIATLLEVQSESLAKMDKKIDATDTKIDKLEDNFIQSNLQEKVEDKKNVIEMKKSKWGFWASIIPGVLALIGAVIAIIIK